MNRKLHNTVTALFATSGLLALSLVASRPLAPDAAPQAGAAVARVEASAGRAEALAADAAMVGELAALSARAATLAAMAEAIDQAEAADAAPTPAHPVRRSHRGRQSVAMPFFSFFPKG